jgi:FdhD protein
MGLLSRQHLVRRLTIDGDDDRSVATDQGPRADQEADQETGAAQHTWTPRSDRVAVEEPLEIRIGGESFSVTMRTPGHDIDLVHGFCYAEGLITRAGDIAGARYCDGTGPDGRNTYNVLDVQLAAGVAPPDPGLRRNVTTTSACGICGSVSIDRVLGGRTEPMAVQQSLPATLIRDAPQLLRAQQKLFSQTGGVHAAGLLGLDAKLGCVREDVGRHNAVDKVIGWALREERLPLSDSILAVSGRASFELTQKAVLAGIPALVAVSAPSSLAVDLAEQAGLTLVGFVRGSSMNVYTHSGRLTPGR